MQIGGTRMQVGDQHSCIAIVTFRSYRGLIFLRGVAIPAYNKSGGSIEEPPLDVCENCAEGAFRRARSTQPMSSFQFSR